MEKGECYKPNYHDWTPILDIATKLEQLHSLGIAHRDIKPENMLIVNQEMRISDYGLSTKETTIFNKEIGTLTYMSPELLTDFDEPIDFDQLKKMMNGHYLALYLKFLPENYNKTIASLAKIKRNFTITDIIRHTSQTQNRVSKHNIMKTLANYSKKIVTKDQSTEPWVIFFLKAFHPDLSKRPNLDH